MAGKASKTAQAGKKTTKAKSQAAPWERDNPKGTHPRHPQHLSPQAKATAKRRARRAGRPYPNLVDNMRAAKEAKK